MIVPNVVFTKEGYLSDLPLVSFVVVTLSSVKGTFKGKVMKQQFIWF